MTTLTAAAALEHQHDLLRAAARRRLTIVEPSPEPPSVALTLRLASAGDAAALRRLEELDEAAPLQAPVLLAITEAGVVSALSLADGAVAADPFILTADAVALLRLRADHVSEAGRRRRRPRLRLRLRPRYA